MHYPTLKEERKLWKQGYRFVACVDEVGRGPLAGPVVATAVALLPISKSQFLISNQFPMIQFLKIRDSKKLTPKARERSYEILTAHPSIRWGIGRVSAKVIDRINILEATKLAMGKALCQLQAKLSKTKYITNSCYSKKRLYIEYLILDGNMKLDVPLPQKSIVKGDEKVFSCAAASIIAKVKRDRAMVRYHKKHPHYGFNQHKGYGTKHHIAMLQKYGPCPLHRKTFNPVSKMTNF